MKLFIIIGFMLALSLVWLRNGLAAEVPVAGQSAPDFALIDQDGLWHKLSDFRGKWLVMYFYPKDDSPHCTTEACQYRDDISKIHALGAGVVGISVDDRDSHAEFAKKHHLPFPLLADKNGIVAARYGSVLDLMLLKFAKRNTFIIDPQGKIAKVYLSVNAATNPAQVVSDLAVLQAAHP
ncbi:MAG: peroxiredoxin [Burkholderiales bacterium]